MDGQTDRQRCKTHDVAYYKAAAAAVELHTGVAVFAIRQ